MGRGSLAERALTLPQFVAVYALPITPADGTPAAARCLNTLRCLGALSAELRGGAVLKAVRWHLISYRIHCRLPCLPRPAPPRAAPQRPRLRRQRRRPAASAALAQQGWRGRRLRTARPRGSPGPSPPLKPAQVLCLRRLLLLLPLYRHMCLARGSRGGPSLMLGLSMDHAQCIACLAPVEGRGSSAAAGCGRAVPAPPRRHLKPPSPALPGSSPALQP